LKVGDVEIRAEQPITKKQPFETILGRYPELLVAYPPGITLPTSMDVCEVDSCSELIRQYIMQKLIFIDTILPDSRYD
jgi:hypothetical protein